jgi:hypothetical protein
MSAVAVDLCAECRVIPIGTSISKVRLVRCHSRRFLKQNDLHEASATETYLQPQQLAGYMEREWK